MRFITSLRQVPLRLHTKTIIIISLVITSAFVVIGYFSDLMVTKLSDQQEQEQAEIFAAQVADTVSYHVTHVKRALRQTPGESLKLDWVEVREDIVDTLLKSTPQLAQVRVFYRTEADQWEEALRLPAEAGPPSAEEAKAAEQEVKGFRVISSHTQRQHNLVRAMAPVISPFHNRSSRQIGTATVVLSFDESQSTIARMRRFIWPLRVLAIVALTLATYVLFRYLIYEPIDGLLFSMAKAEAGDLSAEIQPVASDEIGKLTSQFNRMLGRIRQTTEQLDVERRSLKERVGDATAEIEGRKRQLEEANLRLYELQRQLTQLERLAAAGQLAAQFAHEVGTPLNLISGHVQVLRARITDERLAKRLNVVAGQIKRITQIVRAMLDSTRPPGLRLERVDINSLLMHIIETAQPTLVAHQVKLRTVLAEGLPPIEVDSDQMQQVFINLINNSLDAMPAGGNLTVTTKQDDAGVVIDVADTGEGITPEQIELIFNPLFTTKRDRGTGLGLTVVQQIVLEHSGTIEVESQPGQGTVFHIELPPNVESASLEAQQLV